MAIAVIGNWREPPTYRPSPATRMIPPTWREGASEGFEDDQQHGALGDADRHQHDHQHAAPAAVRDDRLRRVEVIVGAERRRRWSPEEKARITAESLEPGANVSAGLSAVHRAAIPEFIEKHGGRYIVRGAEPTVMEGDWAPDLMVILEFPSRENAQAFLADPDAQPLFALRHNATTSKLVMADGCV